MSAADDVNFGAVTMDILHIVISEGNVKVDVHLHCFLLSSLCLKNMSEQALLDGSC